MRTLLALIFALGLNSVTWADVMPDELERDVDPFEPAHHILKDLESQQ